jgi:hypothetical protein
MRASSTLLDTARAVQRSPFFARLSALPSTTRSCGFSCVSFRCWAALFGCGREREQQFDLPISARIGGQQRRLSLADSLAVSRFDFKGLAQPQDLRFLKNSWRFDDPLLVVPAGAVKPNGQQGHKDPTNYDGGRNENSRCRV